jgi:hypothetical protein
MLQPELQLLCHMLLSWAFKQLCIKSAATATPDYTAQQHCMALHCNAAALVQRIRCGTKLLL